MTDSTERLERAVVVQEQRLGLLRQRFDVLERGRRQPAWVSLLVSAVVSGVVSAAVAGWILLSH